MLAFYDSNRNPKIQTNNKMYMLENTDSELAKTISQLKCKNKV